MSLNLHKNEIETQTAIGKVKAVSLICAKNITKDCITLKLIKFKPRLPTGMSVQNCTAILLTIDSQAPIQSLEFSVTIASKALGSSCTGQHLDAQEWRNPSKLITIGTEDREALMQRMPELKFENIVIKEFSPHSMTLCLQKLHGIKRPSFHFIIAENDNPELAEDSTWFAVDQSHNYVLEQ